MDDKKRGDDAQDHAPRSVAETTGTPPDEKQDAPNYKRTDGGTAIEVDDLSSANDEGAP